MVENLEADVLRRVGSYRRPQGMNDPVSTSTSASLLPVAIIDVEPLEESDVTALMLARALGDMPCTVLVPPQKTVKELRDKHREIARLVVLGHSNKEIMESVDISNSQLAVVKRSPAFAELVARMTDERDREAVDLASRMQVVATKGLDALEQFVDSQIEEGITDATMIMTMFREMADRIGHAPVKTVVSTNFDAKGAEAFRRAFANEGRVKVFDATEADYEEIEQATEPQASQANKQIDLVPAGEG